jgi:hypothetical protein
MKISPQLAQIFIRVDDPDPLHPRSVFIPVNCCPNSSPTARLAALPKVGGQVGLAADKGSLEGWVGEG